MVQNADDDPPARLGDWLTAAGFELDVVRVYDGEPLPAGLDDYRALVVLGGPQQSYGPEAPPWSGQLTGLLREAVGTGLATLGVCLGGQYLAQATGGLVRRGDGGPEVGARLVAKRDAAGDDPLFSPLPLMPDVLQWHSDEIAVLPGGATLLASSPACANQAFRVGRRGYGLQFHIETDEAMVKRWAEEDRDRLIGLGVDVDALLAGALAVHPDLEEVWRPFAARFAALAEER